MNQFSHLFDDALAGFARWLGIDPDAASEQLHEYITEGADPTQLDWQHLLARLSEGDLDHFSVGERAPAGTFECQQCGTRQTLKYPRLLEPCIECSHHEYRYLGPDAPTQPD